MHKISSTHQRTLDIQQISESLEIQQILKSHDLIGQGVVIELVVIEKVPVQTPLCPQLGLKTHFVASSDTWVKTK